MSEFGSPAPVVARDAVVVKRGRVARLRRQERIRRRPEFQQAYDCGARLRGRYLTVFILPNRRPVSRFGVAASRKLGGAVVRNRAKRLIREVLRHNKPSPGFDIVVVPTRELPAASLTALEAEYRRHLDRYFSRR